MNMRFQDYVSLAVMSLALGLQGCGGGDSHVKNIASPVDSSVAASLVGTAVKGVIANADCVVTAANQTTVLYTSVGKTTACTDANGAYTIELDTVPTGPVILELLARTGTTMKCDFPTNCGSVLFGEDVALGSDFSLRAIVPSVSGTTLNQVNVTPWSELAAARAIAETATGGTLVAAEVQSAQLAVAAILNNLLGLEGSADAFGSDLLSIDPINLNAPTGTANSETRRGSLLSLASASLFSLVGGSFTNIEAVIAGLVAAFKVDGEFNVNDSATGIVSTDGGIDLADMLTSIASTASSLPSGIATTINSLLGTGTTLTSIATEATSFAELKEAVVDAAKDSTKPQPPAAVGVSDADKTKKLALDLDNVLAAGVVAFADESSTTSVLQDLGFILENSGADELEKFENLFDLIEAANVMITLGASTPGCTATSTTVTCTLPEAAALVDNDETDLDIGSGTLVYTISTNTVSANSVIIGSDAYALTQVGTSATVNALQVASINLGNNSTTDISLGAGSTVTAVLASSELTSLSVDAQSVAITIAGQYSFEGDLAVTRNTALRDTVLSSFDMNGEFTILRTDDSLTSNSGESVATRLKFTSSLNGSTVPSFDGQSTGETSTNFYTISNAVFQVEQDVAYDKRSIGTNDVIASGSTEERLVITVSGTRDSFDLTDAKLRLSLLNATAAESLTLTGSVELTDGVETYTLSNGQAKAVVVVSDASFTGTLMVGTEQTGRIDSDGLVIINGGNPIQLGSWAAN